MSDIFVLQKELDKLEQVFRDTGYSQQMIDEIKYSDGADKDDIEWHINNLEEEQSNWDC